MAMFLTLFMLLGVLTIDMGIAFANRARYQADVDFAALAAAQELPADPLLAALRAEQYLEANGWDLADPDIQVTVVTVGSDRFEVVARRVQRPLLGSLFGISFDIGARAVSERILVSSGEYAILVLNQTACQAFSVQGNADLIVEGGGIAVNSSCPTDAVSVGGNGDVVSDVFNYYFAGGVATNGSADITPWPVPVSAPVLDPLAAVAPPDLATLGISPDSGGTPASPSMRTINGSGSYTLNPGVYYGGLEIRGNTDVTMLPGIYAMAGGGFHVNGNADVSGAGVMIYNTLWNSSCGDITLSGNAPLNLSGYGFAPYEGIAFWQDVACTLTMVHRGNADAIGGVIYLPAAGYDLAGNGDLGSMQLIADTVYVHGAGDLTMHYEAYVEPASAEILRLIE